MGLCEDDPSCDNTYNAVMPLSHALTRGRYSRIVGITVGDGHELGQGWIPEDGIVWQVDVGDVKVNELSAIVVALA